MIYKNIEIEEIENGIKIIGQNNFEPSHIFDCGQCFRWIKEDDGSYTGVAMGKILNVSKRDGDIILINTNLGDFENIWYDYFDLGRDYGQMIDKLKVHDDNLLKATEFGHGIRLLQQDGWEMLISFIISSNNRIPMIQRAINNISENYGDCLGEYKGKTYYSFPSPAQLSKASVEDLRNLKLGFRDKYVYETTKAVLESGLDIVDFIKMEADICHKELMKFKGVGAKVADCIALFGMRKYDSFPVDVWVKRVMQEFYGAEDMSLVKMRAYGRDLFGEDAGFAQQYLFYYVRELEIGK
ncbi:DNA-3-methyladenine glycosylase family protein [Peptostreptococcus anaerobius]|uniref:DNA-3-methyladenine glycosylase family protein n=1 Tax=Peptostreptococcus anaerobius TaxID=1261 RepID=UPI00189AFEBA|nr:DNA glycosylase [Peptostreptococcus anaerobius]MDB8850949.1 DNA glycosylase [Peptostreptococcus anaerobius]MDK8277322.1 DNA glycosylase [Peptostreptococcus anaerobius]